VSASQRRAARGERGVGLLDAAREGLGRLEQPALGRIVGPVVEAERIELDVELLEQRGRNGGGLEPRHEHGGRHPRARVQPARLAEVEQLGRAGHLRDDGQRRRLHDRTQRRVRREVLRRAAQPCRRVGIARRQAPTSPVARLEHERPRIGGVEAGGQVRRGQPLGSRGQLRAEGRGLLQRVEQQRRRARGERVRAYRAQPEVSEARRQQRLDVRAEVLALILARAGASARPARADAREHRVQRGAVPAAAEEAVVSRMNRAAQPLEAVGAGHGQVEMVDLVAVVVLVGKEEDRDHGAPQALAEQRGEADGGGGLVRDERRAAAEHRLLPGDDDERVARRRRAGRREQAAPVGARAARGEGVEGARLRRERRRRRRRAEGGGQRGVAANQRAVQPT
jgi:hypothetical protein